MSQPYFEAWPASLLPKSRVRKLKHEHPSVLKGSNSLQNHATNYRVYMPPCGVYLWMQSEAALCKNFWRKVMSLEPTERTNEWWAPSFLCHAKCPVFLKFLCQLGLMFCPPKTSPWKIYITSTRNTKLCTEMSVKYNFLCLQDCASNVCWLVNQCIFGLKYMFFWLSFESLISTLVNPQSPHTQSKPHHPNQGHQKVTALKHLRL